MAKATRLEKLADPLAAQAKSERQSRALRALDPASYFGLNPREAFFYKLLCLVYHRRERAHAGPIVEELMSVSDALSDFDRGRLLGMIDSLYKAESISLHMHSMLQIEVQNRKDWSA